MRDSEQTANPPNLSVLVVEDDANLREAIVYVLEGAGYEVIAVPDGALALGVLTQGILPGVILLDLMMPVMDGWEFRQHQLADPSLASIPVIVVSADPRGVKLVGSPGVHDVLVKPVEVEALLESLARLPVR